MRRSGDPGLLPYIERVARFAWWAHPGRLADGALEHPLLEIGRRLADSLPASGAELPRPASSASRTLHVASEVFVTGGHTRILAKWIQRDLSSSHAIILTRQSSEIPAFLKTIAADRCAPISALDPNRSIVERAQQVRALSRGFDRVILHHHPDDAVPTIAYAKHGGCPVAMFNHAHFWFSLGSSVSDMIINTTPYFRGVTERHRFSRATDIVDGPPGIERLHWTDIDKRQAKERLGLLGDRPVIMSIGHEQYFTPSKEVNFFNTLAKILTARADVEVLLVGVGQDSDLVPSELRETGRVRLVGPVADPRPYYEAADLCLESAPMPSLGAVVEAVAYGQAFPVLAFAKDESPLHVKRPQFAGISERQATEGDYVGYVCALIDARQTAFERAGELRRGLVAEDEQFGDQFASLYERIARLDHVPRELPRTECSAAPENLVLASLTNPSLLTQGINDLPIRRVVQAHLRAASEGFERPRTAAYQAARRVVRSAYRRLPEPLQRRSRRP